MKKEKSTFTSGYWVFCTYWTHFHLWSLRLLHKFMWHTSYLKLAEKKVLHSQVAPSATCYRQYTIGYRQYFSNDYNINKRQRTNMISLKSNRQRVQKAQKLADSFNKARKPTNWFNEACHSFSMTWKSTILISQVPFFPIQKLWSHLARNASMVICIHDH